MLREVLLCFLKVSLESLKGLGFNSIYYGTAFYIIGNSFSK